ncbi:beta-galactosidase GalB [Hymenobacter sp. CRA2]|uniref:beta-galactosidase GalB n=1 Tax=Hymenobacter sp. CRA2 TaxID=1955620 RepID=UPI00098EC39D|nr:beta-galactosidase GalB [Hymenobacter sp. CRA2]OON67534.1 glycoside hydrolase [Hymenobacter sp. CRA2]
MLRLFALLLLSLSFPGHVVAAPPQTRRVEDFNKDWKFYLGDDARAKDSGFNDASWRPLTLPHDWSIEGRFDEKNPAKPEGGGLPTGVGWYRKTFVLPATAGQRVYIEFDGVYRNSEVWLNGQLLGRRPNGYVSFRYDLTPHLRRTGGTNVLAVRVDNSAQPNSRWYSGSGIYRNVRLLTTNAVAVDQWGTFVTTPQVSREAATVAVETTLRSASGGRRRVHVETAVVDAKGKTVARHSSDNVTLADSGVVTQTLQLKKPQLWSLYRPTLYRVQTRVFDGKTLVDEYETPLGIRFFEFNAQSGFSLNGAPLRILGVNQHHDLGALGAAVNVRAMERQLEILRRMGCNAIRMAHNPPAPELLDLCDRMGFLVMDEAFDQWQKKKNGQDYHKDFKQWHRRDLQDMVRRDRNHPSIIAWSIGNEIREQFDSTGVRLTKELTATVKRLDSTRPVTSALTEQEPDKNYISQAGVLDILSFNYKHEGYPLLPKSFPGQVFLATETAAAFETRGHYDMPADSVRVWPLDGKTKLTTGNRDFTASSYDNARPYWGATHESAWRGVKQNPHIAGLFVWSGFDYLGEPLPYPWPARSSYFGLVDLAGFPKDAYYLYQSEWTNQPVLHVLPHWNWRPGQMVDVWAYYSQAEEVELLLNGKSLGVKKKQGDELHVAWRVKYEPGTLQAVSRRGGQAVLTRTIRTAGPATRIELTADRSTLGADGKDLSFVTVRVLDAQGNLVPDAAHQIRFGLSGPGLVAGVDNGYQASLEPFKATERRAYNGMCLAIVQTTEQPGTIVVQAVADGLQPASLLLKSEASSTAAKGAAAAGTAGN